MTNWTPGRPDSTEYTSHAGGYVSLVPGDDVMSVLSSEIEKTIALFKSLDPSLSYGPGKWTVKQMLQHVIDTERIFTARMLRLARHDEIPLPGFEQDDYAANAPVDHRDYGEMLEEFRIVRQSSLMLYRSLLPDAWKRRGTVSEQSVTVRGLIFTSAGHELYHAKLLRERYVPLKR
jgi:uncharacterized damage-inducible protein DinB